jgi:very-short-patch-repair endonuclease
LQRFQGLANVWAPVAERDQFRWHGLVEQPDPERERDALGRLLDELAVAVGELHDQLPALALAAGLPEPRSLDGAARLLGVCAHCQAQPPTEPGWWSSPELEELERLVVELAADAAAHQNDLAVLHAAYGPGWAALDVQAAGRLTDALTVLQRIWPDLGRADAPPQPGGMSEPTGSDDRGRLERLIGFCAQTTRLVEELQTAGARLARALGAPAGERTVNDVEVFATVARDADAAVRPESSWTDPDVAERLAGLLDQLDEHLNSYQAHGPELEAVFNWPVAEQLDLDRLCHRYGTAPVWEVLTPGWWRDRVQLRRATRAGRVNRAVIDRLNLARQRQFHARALDELEEDNQQLLGRFYQPRATDTSAARAGLQRLQHAATHLGNDYHPAGVAAQLAGERPSDPELAAVARQVLGTLATWFEQGHRLAGGHADAHTGLTLSELGIWAATTTAALSTSMELLDAVNHQRHTPTGLAGAQTELRLAATVHARRRRFEELPDAQRTLIGRRYQGLESAWDELVTGVRWTRTLQQRHGGPLPTSAAAALHANPHPPNPIHLQQRWELANKHREGLLDRFESARRADLAAELGGPLDEVSEVLADLTDHLDQVEIWHAFATRTRWLGEQGFAAAVDYCTHHIADPTLVPQVLEAALWQAWYAAVAATDPALTGVRAEDLDGRVARFRELDRYLISSARGRVIQASLARRPSYQIGPASEIKSQARRQRGNWPIRKLLGRAGPLATRLKPCFMMSPLAVSELIPPDFEFDTVVFDEASQITPANAIGCLYRANQIIVVGDPRQLPPSRFFQSSTTADDLDDEDGDEDTPDYESVLDLCSSAAHLPSLRLRWHYRSQHDSLITFSNHRFYADQPLLVFPAASSTPPADLGVGFTFVPDGRWDRALHVNQTEAERVAELALAHAALHPEPGGTGFRSLGIVTCNEPQAELIEERIAQLRSDRPELDAFFNDPDPLRRWFVRSIEHVQGDERDHIILSLGYAHEKISGKLNLNFGPLIYKQGGQRRLNVAVTRARYRLEVVASFTADDLAARHSNNPSIHALQAFLDYAERGIAALAIDRSYSDRAPESPLEQSVYDTIRAWGYTVECQIGTAGYRIDLGIRHPDLPGRFALGIECDGAAYHSSSVARDRDRLRQQLLERLGWQLYRIWGPAWYRDRRTQEHRLRNGIDTAINTSSSYEASDLPGDQRLQVAYVAVDLDQHPAWATTYQPYTTTLTLTGDPTSYSQRHQLTAVVRDILAIEAPIHTHFLARRVSKLWNTRARPSLRETVEDLLAELARAGVCRLEGDYAWPPNTNEVSVRTPTATDPETKREVIHVPDAELRVAICNLLRDADTLGPDKLTEHAARLFGWEHTGSRIRTTIQRLTTQLQAERHITQTADGRLRLHITT